MRGKFLLVLIAVVILASSLALSSGAAVSPLDGFDPDPDAAVRDIVVQPDGKVLVGGFFTSIAGTAQNYLARLNTDGSMDLDFNPNINSVLNGGVSQVALQPDGKIVIIGKFLSIEGLVRAGIARLNGDGSLDTSFSSISIGGGGAVSLAIQPDNMILVGGHFETVNGIPRQNIARFNPDGSLDTGFAPVVEYLSSSPAVLCLTVQSDGRILIGGEFDTVNGITRNNIARLMPNGSLDTAFNPDANNLVAAITIQPDGKILIGGFFFSVGGQYRAMIARLNTDGTLDSGFDIFVLGAIGNITLQKDGKVLICGEIGNVGGETRTGLARLHPDGTLDTGFNPVLDSPVVVALAVQPDGKVLFGSAFSKVNGISRNRIARVYNDGTLDDDFVADANNRVITLALQPDGKILVGGELTSVHHPPLSAVPRDYLFRLNVDGAVDSTFSDPQPNGFVYALAVQPDGKILMGGNFTSFNAVPWPHLARLNPDGSLDTAFQGEANMPVRAFALQPDGRILIGGSFTSVNGVARKRIARLNPDGTLDTGFNPDVNNNVASLVLQQDGKVLLGGAFTTVNGASRNRLARLNTDGSLDTGFNPAADNLVAVLALQPDGKILVGGWFAAINGETRNNIARLNPGGSLDSAFDPNANGAVGSIAVQPDGKIVLGGAFTILTPGSIVLTRNRIARLNGNGSVDRDFEPDVDNIVHCLVIQPDGKIILGGDFTSIDLLVQLDRLARLSSSGAALQSLSIGSDGHSFTWRRSGTGPELGRVTFELSQDTTTWTSLGSGSRVAGGWQLVDGIMLPEEKIRYIRTRGYYASGTFNGSGSMVESVWQVYRTRPAGPFPWHMFLPAITGAAVQ